MPGEGEKVNDAIEVQTPEGIYVVRTKRQLAGEETRKIRETVEKALAAPPPRCVVVDVAEVTISWVGPPPEDYDAALKTVANAPASVVHWYYDEDRVALDGSFTAAQLRAIAWKLERGE